MAAQFHRRAFHAFGGELHQMFANRNRAGEADFANDIGRDEMAGDFGRITEDNLRDAAGQAGVYQTADHFYRAGRRFFRRFQNDRAACGNRGREFSNRRKYWKIPRAECCHRAYWLIFHQ